MTASHRPQHETERQGWLLAGNSSDEGTGEQARSNSQPDPGPPELRDADLLDAYSQAVIRVVRHGAPAVISVSGSPGERPGGSGSGFLISSDGYAVTNSHVVHGRLELIAQTDDGDQISASVIGDDPATDVALLRLRARDLPVAEWGDSDTLQVGQLVIAMGSPLGLHSTVSTGVVSALHRSMRGYDGRLIENVVQHAAPINPGNSGGPLLDSRGRVIGVNTAIIAMAQGLGFAVPANTASWVAGEILAHGQVRRRRLGIVARAARLSRKMLKNNDLLADEGVQVLEVEPGSLGHRAGLQAGDIIVSLADRLITSVDDLHRLLSRVRPEQPFEIAAVRNDEVQVFVVRPN